MAKKSSKSTQLHPILEAAAKGDLPDWTAAKSSRKKHLSRVGDLLREWAKGRGESKREVNRWAALGYLHDALRDADSEILRKTVNPTFLEFAGDVIHGPAAAARLRQEGVADEEFLHAIDYHTLGSPDFGTMGRALYAADFLEPGRKLRVVWRASLRERAPKELDQVVKEVVHARLRHLIDRSRPLHPKTVAFWNRITEGGEWAAASEL